MSTRSLYGVPIVLWSLLILLIHMLNCLGTNGFSIKLIPRYSIDSVLFPKNSSQQEKHNRLVELSKTRALHFQSTKFADTINSTKQGIKELQPFVRNYENLYAVKVEIGTPPYNALLLIDTGSDVTWVQGEGCTECFTLIFGNFKYQESSTYTAMPCDHTLCVPRICIEDICRYRIVYSDDDYTKGKLSFEAFKFPLPRVGSITYKNVIFGVGLINSNRPFMREENEIGGIFGLGRGPQSILSQLAGDTHLRFSYCLFDSSSGQDTYTYLHFGDDAQITGFDQAMVETTSLLPTEDGYYVKVLGITMNRKLLPINQREFELKADSNGGFVIDSRTTLTYLVPNAYNVVRNEIVRYLLQAYNWNTLVNSGLNFDLCYNVQPTENQQFPSLGITFLGAYLELGPERVFKSVSNNISCMFIKPTSKEDVNILGTIQQQDY